MLNLLRTANTVHFESGVEVVVQRFRAVLPLPTLWCFLGAVRMSLEMPTAVQSSCNRKPETLDQIFIAGCVPFSNSAIYVVQTAQQSRRHRLKEP